MNSVAKAPTEQSTGKQSGSFTFENYKIVKEWNSTSPILLEMIHKNDTISKVLLNWMGIAEGDFISTPGKQIVIQVELLECKLVQIEQITNPTFDPQYASFKIMKN